MAWPDGVDCDLSLLPDGNRVWLDMGEGFVVDDTTVAFGDRRDPDPGVEEGRARTFHHQWVVRGHWRQQPCGPRQEERRTTWVPSGDL